MTHQQNKDAMDLYHEWVCEFINVTGFYEFVICNARAVRAIGLMEERANAGIEELRHAAMYASDMNQALNSKLKTLMN